MTAPCVRRTLDCFAVKAVSRDVPQRILSRQWSSAEFAPQVWQYPRCSIRWYVLVSINLREYSSRIRNGRRSVVCTVRLLVLKLSIRRWVRWLCRLLGITSVQVYMYYSSSGARDSRRFKVLVRAPHNRLTIWIHIDASASPQQIACLWYVSQ